MDDRVDCIVAVAAVDAGGAAVDVVEVKLELEHFESVELEIVELPKQLDF